LILKDTQKDGTVVSINALEQYNTMNEYWGGYLTGGPGIERRIFTCLLCTELDFLNDSITTASFKQNA
jgi:hypothetical protein